MVKWLRLEWQEVLPVWLATKGQLQGPEGETWPCPALADHWKEAVQSLLSESLPKPEPKTALVFINKVTGGCAEQFTADALGAAVMDLSAICPLLAVKLLEVSIKTMTVSVRATVVSTVFTPLQGLNPCNDQVADDLAFKHGGRDGVWLRSCIPGFHELNQSHRTLPLAYRRLAMNSEFRKFAFGVWLQEIRFRLHL